MERLRFGLHRQLLLVSLLLLSLPWAGCQFAREMEGALRQGQVESLQATAGAIAAVIGERRALIYPDPARMDARPDTRPIIHARPAPQAVVLDGYAEGWENLPVMALDDPSLNTPLSLRLRATTDNDRLYLLVQVRDAQVEYHNPGLSPEPNGDRLLLHTWQSGRRQAYVIATAAPGTVRARFAGKPQPGIDPGRIRGYWQDAEGGYTLELEIPLAMTGERLGFYVVNAQSTANTPFETLGNITPLDTRAPPWLIYTPAALRSTLRPFTDAARSIEVTDRAGWVIADLEPGAPAAANSETFWLLRLLYRSILAERDLPEPPAQAAPGKLPDIELSEALAGNSAHFRYREPGSATRTVLAASAPVRHGDDVLGAVVVRQSSEQYLSLTDRAFSRLLGYSLAAVGLGALGMLGYATLLSWRIRQLNRSAHAAVGSDGAVTGDFPRSGAPDEIGELSRAYADLLAKLREYNSYLRSLSRSLSHELRTPIAVIQTSLENIEQGHPDARQTYLARARGGLNRLNRILTAMSEANQLEESIRSNPRQPVDLGPLVQEMGAAYRGMYPDNPISVSTPDEPARVLAAPDLIAQALDKLVDNAVSFSAGDPTIAIDLWRDGPHWRLAVTNQGPPLPPALSSTLFEPMVSGRAQEDDEVHLGLGLHVARLICDYHGGSIEVTNVYAPAGVTVTLVLPVGEGES